MVEVLSEPYVQDTPVFANGFNSNGNINEHAYQSIMEEPKLTPIQSFYKGQCIFVTGGTGFVGKLLIEKLLRGCPGISTIYMLMRPKKGKDIHQRVEEIFDDSLFDKLREKHPKFRHQIVPVAGDCLLPGLDLSEADTLTITRNVSVVFHVAATVRFDERMKFAVPINVRTPKDIMQLCKKMSRLQAVIHVSTAYANCPLDSIEEKVYDSPMEPDKLLALVDCMDENLIDEITPRLLGDWPNTYTFTKAVAESVIIQEAGNMPAGIFRPAIVISTYREPLRGWIDNLYGPTGVVAGAGTGVLRSIHCDGSIEASVVPVDLTVNAIIACAWDVAHRRKSTSNEGVEEQKNEIPVYNFVSKDNPISYEQLKSLSEKYGLEFPTEKAIWYYTFRNRKHKFMHFFCIYFLHLLPALLIDAVTFCIGKQPRMLKIYKKIHKFLDVLNYFTMKGWKFSDNNIKELLNKMSPEDRENFSFDIGQVNWEHFFQMYVRGIRIYLIKDPLDTLPQARVKWQRLYWIHQALKLLVAYGLLRICWSTMFHLFRDFSWKFA